MKITNATPFFNVFNNGFTYLCNDENGDLWIRSVAGKWAKLSSIPMKFDDLLADFDAFIANNQPSTEADVITDNKGSTVVEPPKYIPPPALDFKVVKNSDGLTLEWKGVNIETLTASGAWIGEKNVSGAEVITKSGEYTLTYIGDDDSTDSLTVKI